MRYQFHDLNGADVILQGTAEWDEIDNVLQDLKYGVQLCRQKDRETELIFSPSTSNERICDRLTALGWAPGVALQNPSYDTGKEVDFYKNGIVLEVQFAHYGLLQTDISRMQRLFDGGLKLSNGGKVKCGIEIVVNSDMPTSQSVSHFGQATSRGAAIASSVPLRLVGIEKPCTGDSVIEYEVPERARKAVSSKEIKWP